MDTQAFLNNAKALLMITNDQWTKGFVTSLIEQVSSGRTLSEKQISIFNTKLDAIFNPPTPVEIDQEFVSQVDALKNRTRSQWLLDFCDSLLTQMKAGRALSEKQKVVFKRKYDWLVLKIKPVRDKEVEPEWEDFIDQDNF
jgi:hypothetical protein